MANNETNNISTINSVEVFTDSSMTNNLLIALNHYRLKGIFTDVILCVCQEEFPCHKAVLSSSSAYFEAMFSSPFREELDSKVYMEDVSPWTMKRILDFVYTGSIEISCANVEDLLRTSSRLQYTFLVDNCAEFMKCRLDADNCIGVHITAQLLSLSMLEEVAWKFCLENFATASERSDWLQLNVEQMLKFIQNDDIDVKSEEIVFNSCIRWINHSLEQRNCFLKEILENIRLPHLSESFLRKQLQELEIIIHDVPCQTLLLQAIIIRKSALLGVDQNMSLELCNTILNSEENSTSEDESSAMETPNYSNSYGIDEKNLAPVPYYSCPAPRPSTFRREVLVAIGGIDVTLLNCVEVFDCVKRSWNANVIPKIPQTTVWSSVCVVNNDIFITGGIKDNVIISSVYKYSTEEERWSICQAMPVARAFHSSVCVKGRILVFGGVNLLLFSNKESQPSRGSNNATTNEASTSENNSNFITRNPLVRPYSSHSDIDSRFSNNPLHSSSSWNYMIANNSENWNIQELGVEQVDCYNPERNEWTTIGSCESTRKDAVSLAVNETGPNNRKSKKRREPSSTSTALCPSPKVVTVVELGGLIVPSSNTCKRNLNNSPAPSQNITIHKIDYDNDDFRLATTSDYIMLPKPINRARCVTKQNGSMLYILWEDTGEFAVLNLVRNSIVFLCSFPRSSSFPRGVLHCGMATFQDNIFVVGGCYRTPRDWSNSPSSANMWCFNPETNSWSILPEKLQQPRGLHALVSLKM